MTPLPWRLEKLGARPPLPEALENTSPRALVFYMLDIAHYLMLDKEMLASRDQPHWEICASLVEASRTLLNYAIRRKKAQDRAWRKAAGIKRRV